MAGRVRGREASAVSFAVPHFSTSVFSRADCHRSTPSNSPRLTQPPSCAHPPDSTRPRSIPRHFPLEQAMSQQQPLLYGTSSVPYSPVSAAPSALVYSADGQYAIVTRGEINIFVRFHLCLSSSSSELTLLSADTFARLLEPCWVNSARSASSVGNCGGRREGKRAREGGASLA